jgi:hypothetical protein
MTKTMKIAFQGEQGANSHIAVAEAYPDAEPLACPTFEDALAAITSGEADLGMIRSKTRSPAASPTSIICCRNPACSSSANGFCRSITS